MIRPVWAFVFYTPKTPSGGLIVGAPVEAANTLAMTPEQITPLYPDGPKALPPELQRTAALLQPVPRAFPACSACSC
jgi:hypothetical protein